MLVRQKLKDVKDEIWNQWHKLKATVPEVTPFSDGTEHYFSRLQTKCLNKNS